MVRPDEFLSFCFQQWIGRAEGARPFRPDKMFRTQRRKELARLAKARAEGSGGLACACPANRILAEFLSGLKCDIEEETGGATDNMFLLTLKKATQSVIETDSPVTTDAQLRKLKHIGPKLVQIVKEYLWSQFPPLPLHGQLEEQAAPVWRKTANQEKKSTKRKRAAALEDQFVPGEPTDPSPKKQKGAVELTKEPYCPGVGTANYAFLITLYRNWKQGGSHMSKDELMRHAEDSGLSSKSVYGTGYQNGAAGRFYNGWSNVKKLKNGDPPLVLVWSNPHKIRLTEEGRELAERLHNDAVERNNLQPLPKTLEQPATRSCCQPSASQEQVLHKSGTAENDRAFSSGTQLFPKEPSIPPVNNQVVEKNVIILDSDGDITMASGSRGGSNVQTGCMPGSKRSILKVDCSQHSAAATVVQKVAMSQDKSAQRTMLLVQPPPPGHHQSVATYGQDQRSRTGRFSIGAWRLPLLGSTAQDNGVCLPPLSAGRTFSQEYEVVLVVDNREKFSEVSCSQHLNRPEALEVHLERIRAKGIKVDHRQLAQGDALWVARRLSPPFQEYVLDFIVERKRADDLVSSIKSGRYEQQKYWLTRCGLRHKLYLVEGDLDIVSQGQSGKTASVATEVLDGFAVLFAAKMHDVVNLYARLTGSIRNLYEGARLRGVGDDHSLMTYSQFNEKMTSMKKLTVRDVWGLILMRIPGVGNDVAEAILNRYATPISLWNAYQRAAERAQSLALDPRKEGEKLLSKLPTSPLRTIGPATSKRVFESLFPDQ